MKMPPKYLAAFFINIINVFTLNIISIFSDVSILLNIYQTKRGIFASINNNKYRISTYLSKQVKLTFLYIIINISSSKILHFSNHSIKLLN